MSRRTRALGAMVALSSALGACAPHVDVQRAVDGRVIDGDFVPAEAYAAYLRGIVAEQSGKPDDAYVAYLATAGIGPRDPEPWTRLGALECARDPARGREALDRALAIDAHYAPAWVARARCATDPSERLHAAERALMEAPTSDDALGPLLAPGSPENDATARWSARLFAATLARPTDVDAWRALGAWAHDRGLAAIEERAIGRWARLDPRDRAGIATAVARLAGDGALAEARRAAAVVVEATAHEPAPLVARLAIDDALVAGDRDRAERVCLRAHLPVTVAAARALLLGLPRAAASLVGATAAADPSDVEARVVRALAARAEHDHATLASALGGAAPLRSGLSIEAWLAFARAAALDLGSDDARALLARVPRVEPPSALDGDAVVTPVAVSLATAGLLDAAMIGPNGRVELAERLGERLAPVEKASLDRRHALLALARTAPAGADTLLLARDLAPSKARDPLVAIAFARLAMAGAPGVKMTPETLASFDPTDPLVAAAALDLAVVARDSREIPAARRRLAAVARTPAERARLVE